MGNKDYYLIGEFSKRTGISVRTLHYYDEIGLLTPGKDLNSGHRQYSDEDVITLQKILTLKFVGYSLEQIAEMLHHPDFSVTLKETLEMQRTSLEKEKTRIEASLRAIKRTMNIMEEDGEVDSAVLMSLMSGFQAEKDAEEWLDKKQMSELLVSFPDKTEEELAVFDKVYIDFVKEVKRLAGTAIEAPEVEKMINDYMSSIYNFMGENVVEKLSNIENLDEINVDKLEDIGISPFTDEEEVWLNKAMEYLMTRSN